MDGWIGWYGLIEGWMNGMDDGWMDGWKDE